MPTRPKPPAHLSAASRKWWREVVQDFGLEPHHLLTLALACQALDRAEQARAALAESGLTFRDRLGNPRPHPAVAIERNSMVAFARLVRELGLDAVEPDGPRPPPLRGQR